MSYIITFDQLATIMPLGSKSGRLQKHFPFINPALEFGNITSLRNVAAFLGQEAHESGEYLYTRELASGADYEGRADLGNVQEGDGRKYRGRGAIQVTGRAAARACGQFFGQPFEEQPELMELPEWATHVSVWFWSIYKTVNNIPVLPLFAEMDWFKTCTHYVNGGYNHLAERVDYWNRARQIFGLNSVNIEEETADIQQFQRAHNLGNDGVAGAMTAAAVRDYLASR